MITKVKKYAIASILLLTSLIFLAISAACAESGQDDTLAAYLLADELRQTSDDLTRMARLYSVTGEDRYKEYFQRILDIRNGMVARPANPNVAYWDIAISTGEMPPTDGQTGALRDLLKDAGLSSEQLELVARAEERSNALAQIESEAFGSSVEEARNLLHGDEYNRLKAEIMQPVNELLQSLLDG